MTKPDLAPARRVALLAEATSLLSAAVTKLEAASAHEARARAYSALVWAMKERDWARERLGAAAPRTWEGSDEERVGRGTEEDAADCRPAPLDDDEDVQ